MKAKLIYFVTDNVVRLLTKTIKDGKVKVGKKEYPVDKIKEPKLINWRYLLGLRTKPMPLYFVHHGYAQPLNYDIDRQTFKQHITPDNYAELTKQGAIKQLLTLKGTEKADMVMWMLIGVAIGALAGIIISPTIGVGFI